MTKLVRVGQGHASHDPTVVIDNKVLQSKQAKRYHLVLKPTEPNYTWLVFKEERWQPFDPANQEKVEQTLSMEGTFVDIADPLFPGVKKVRVFPGSNYLSYLGLKYRMSRVLQPDAWSWFP